MMIMDPKNWKISPTNFVVEQLMFLKLTLLHFITISITRIHISYDL